MAVEDFTTYTEVGVGFTITAPKILCEDVDRDVDAYVYKDYGVDNFDGLNIDFEILILATSDINALIGMALSNVINDSSGFAVTDVNVTIAELGGPTFRMDLRRGNTVASDIAFGLSPSTIYYCTLTRDAGEDIITLKIYDDSGRTSLVDTLTVAGFGTVKWRYAYGAVNHNAGTGGRNFDGYVQNMEFLPIPTGWSGGDISGVDITTVAKINGVALADITKVNGVA